MKSKVETAAQDEPSSADSPGRGFNQLGMRIWTADELQLVRRLGEQAKPFSISAARS